MKRLGVAIVGMGNIARAHIEGFKNLSDLCDLKALSDIYPQKALKLATQFGLAGAVVVEDYKALLDRQDIQLVSLCLPPSLHCQIAVDFLEAGKHVICEKPMAPSLEECDHMIEAQKKSGKILSIISQNRFRTAPMRMKALLEQGHLGKVLLARVNSMWWRGSKYYDLWWRGTWEKEGGGCTLNHAVHQIDILQWLIGMPSFVTSVMTNVAHQNSEVEDVSISILQYPSLIAEVNATLVDHDEKQEFFFATEKASVGIPWRVKSVKQLPNGFFEANPKQEEDLQKLYDGMAVMETEGHEAQLADVLNAIQGGRAPLVTGEEGRKAVELVTAMYKSSTEHASVSLPLDKDDPFYHKDSMLALVPRYFKKTASADNLEDGTISLGTMGK